MMTSAGVQCGAGASSEAASAVMSADQSGVLMKSASVKVAMSSAVTSPGGRTPLPADGTSACES